MISFIFLGEVEEVLGIHDRDRGDFHDIGPEDLQQQVLNIPVRTLSSARSFGRKRVTFLPKMWAIWTSEMAVLPELAYTTSLLPAGPLAVRNFLTARSLLLPKGFMN